MANWQDIWIKKINCVALFGDLGIKSSDLVVIFDKLVFEFKSLTFYPVTSLSVNRHSYTKMND